MTAASVIASAVVQAQPQRLAAIADLVAARDGIEIHGHDARGRLVLVMEFDDDASLAACMSELAALPGVLGANLVFHLNDDPAPAPADTE